MRVKRLAMVMVMFAMLWACHALGMVPRMPRELSSTALALLGGLSLWCLASTRSQTALKMVFSVTAVLALLIPIDLLLRPLVDDKSFYREHERFAKRHDRYPDVLRYAPGVDFTGPAYGDLAALSGRVSLREPRRIRFRTDSYGFRNDPAALTNAEFSLLVLADSVGVGNGVDQDKTWASLLRTRYGHRVYNLSQVGNIRTHVLNLQMEEPRLRLATNAVCLLVVFSGNDLEEDPYGKYSGPLLLSQVRVNSARQAFSQRWRSFRNRSSIGRLFGMLRAPVRPMASRVVTFTNAPGIAFYQEHLLAAGRTPDDIRAHANFASFRASLDALRVLCGRKGCTLAICHMPTKEEVYPWIVGNRPMTSSPYAPSGLETVLREYGASNGIAYCDLGPPLSAKARELWREPDPRLVYWRDDTHLNDTGNDVAARALSEFLSRMPRGPGR